LAPVSLPAGKRMRGAGPKSRSPKDLGRSKDLARARPLWQPGNLSGALVGGRPQPLQPPGRFPDRGPSIVFDLMSVWWDEMRVNGVAGAPATLPVAPATRPAARRHPRPRPLPGGGRG